MELEQLHHAYRHGDLQLQGADYPSDDILAELPELQMLNVACNQKKFRGDVLLDNWK